mgnify:CR=1 FL=1
MRSKKTTMSWIISNIVVEKTIPQCSALFHMSTERGPRFLPSPEQALAHRHAHLGVVLDHLASKS